MGFLKGKRILITGVLSNRSIAWGIAQACRQQGAELALTYAGERFRDRVDKFARELETDIVIPCDVAIDEDIANTFVTLANRRDGLAGLVHSMGGEFLDGLTREDFLPAHDISAYSFPALTKAAMPMLEGRPSSVLTLTYLGAERVIPHYNTMGVAKAALEASVRYLAANLGPM